MSQEKQDKKEEPNEAWCPHNDPDCWYCEDAEYKSKHNGKSAWH